MLAPSLQQFSLRTEMLPSYIPIRVAEKILFVGESVQMFENHNHSPSRAGELKACVFGVCFAWTGLTASHQPALCVENRNDEK